VNKTSPYFLIPGPVDEYTRHSFHQHKYAYTYKEDARYELKVCFGIYRVTNSPNKAPISVTRTRAREAPRNMGTGFLYCVTSVKTAN